MAHLQLLQLEYGDVKVKTYRLETLLRGLGYSSLTFEGDGKCNEWEIYISLQRMADISQIPL